MIILDEHNQNFYLNQINPIMDNLKERADFFYTVVKRNQMNMNRVNTPLPCLAMYNGVKKVLEISIENSNDKIERYLNKFCNQV